MTRSHLDQLEAEAIFIMREVAAEFDRPVLMYSVGKDSSVLLRLAQKAFAPGTVPFPLLHVDTGFKFAEMYTFRDAVCREAGLTLNVFKPTVTGMNPWEFGTKTCCSTLKTQALLAALREGEHDAAIGGARRDEERSRAKERVYSFRNAWGQWDPKNQRPELWDIYNGQLRPGENIRVFPLSNWTEIDIWRYIERESIPIVSLYFAAEREVIRRGASLIPTERRDKSQLAEVTERVSCRFRTLGCSPCTGAVESTATTVAQIIAEVEAATNSERITRIIDHDQDGSMEIKKQQGYF